jgi:hypothetical protein
VTLKKITHVQVVNKLIIPTVPGEYAYDKLGATSKMYMHQPAMTEVLECGHLAETNAAVARDPGIYPVEILFVRDCERCTKNNLKRKSLEPWK